MLPNARLSGTDLRPGDLRALPVAQPALGDEVVNATLALRITGVPARSYASSRPKQLPTQVERGCRSWTAIGCLR